ncbi:MAG: ABC transporter ATP-binding protein [Peptococcaceae bacterium]|nr:ABC transporter ATP-binding protein [Peptococcaceae bacterium]
MLSDKGIIAENLCKDFAVREDETVPVLRNINLSIALGQMTGIVGPSGSGKSTLLYCLAGLEPASSGSVQVLGENIATMRRTQSAKFRRDHLGFVFQSYNLVPSMTVEDNLKLPFILRGQKFPRTAAAQTLQRLHIASLLKKNVTLLSGGEQQRVALARVLIANPQIIFADEPTGALDSESVAQVVSELKRMASQPDHAVVMVTHSAEVAAQCDRVIHLRDGQMVSGDEGQVGI